MDFGIQEQILEQIPHPSGHRETNVSLLNLQTVSQAHQVPGTKVTHR